MMPFEPSRMIYLAIHLYNYSQLGKTDPQTSEEIEDYIRDHLVVHGNGGLERFQESFVGQLGESGTLEIAKLADRISKTYNYLWERRDALYGFLLLLVELEDDQHRAGIETRIQHYLLAIEEEDAIWMDEACKELLQEYFELEPMEGLWIVREHSVSFRSAAVENASFCLRNNALKYALDGIASRLNRGSGEPGVLLVRRRESDTHGLVGEMCRIVYGGESPPHPLHLYTIFRRQSAIHPFLNSIAASFLPRIPDFLTEGERRAWTDGRGVLEYLKEPEGDESCFDRLLPDFFGAYNLYLTAYIRMMEERLLPALFFCEHFETYHPDSLEWLGLLVADFMNRDSFLPVFIGKSPDLPDPLGSLRLKPLNLFPVSWREIRNVAGSIFPGMTLPVSMARRLSGLSDGNPVHALHCLYYLRDAGKVERENDEYRWLPLSEKSVRLPKNPAVCSLSLIRRLDPVTVDALYGVYISAGLLEIGGLVSYLNEQGIPRDEGEKALDYLRYLCLIKGDELLIPALPALKKRLESFLGSKAKLMYKGLVEFVSRRYRARRYRHLVLLFGFFARHGRHDLALEIYPHLLRRKLDERDFDGVLPFLEVDRTVFKNALNLEQAARLELLRRTGRLRYTLNSGRGGIVEQVKETLPELRSRYEASRDRGHFLLQLCSWNLVRGQPQEAIEACKQALLDFNECGEQHDEALAYTELGLAMLSAGRLEDAREYLTLSERILVEPTYDRLRTVAFMAIVAFIHGGLTNALGLVQTGASIAGKIGRREWELFLRFFEGRIGFVLGDYGGSYEQFQRCLAFARVYELFAAFDVLYAWMGRSAVYLGDLEHGRTILRRGPERRESAFFLAEACYFENRNRDALKALRPVGQAAVQSPPFPGEMVFWDSGFAGIEGRCLAQEAGGDLLDRLISAFGSYLSAQTGMDDRPIDVLLGLTRANRLSTSDVYNSWYFYLYYLTMPDSGEEDSVDRLTILNKALKMLQERANHIESPVQRYEYLNRNRWNRLLMEEAQRKRLL